MVIFSLYTVAVLAMALRWRRTWRAFAAVCTAIAILMTVALTHYYVCGVLLGVYYPAMQQLLLPYTCVLAAGGLFVSVIPRRLDEGCLRCGYSLQGLESVARGRVVCPECGTRQWGRSDAIVRDPHILARHAHQAHRAHQAHAARQPRAQHADAQRARSGEAEGAVPHPT